VPITTRDLDTRDVRKGGKRIYIVKDHDQAVVRTVPVGVCAAPPRVALQAPAGGEPGPTCPAPLPADLVGRSGLAGRVQRVRDVVRHPLGGRTGR
jgi:hypothetical protein